MKKHIKTVIFVLSSFIFHLSSFIWPLRGHAQVQPLPTSTVPEAETVVELSALETVFNNVLAVATSLAGIAVFIMLIMGGFKWLTSGGDPKKLEAAKGTLTYSIAGLVLMILAWFILLLIKQVTGVNVTLFQIPS